MTAAVQALSLLPQLVQLRDAVSAAGALAAGV